MSDKTDRARQRANDLFAEGLYCGESVVAAVTKVHDGDLGLSPRMATGFCSGMGRSGGTCGALSGGVLVLSAFSGRDDEDGDVGPAYGAVQSLVGAFEEAFGSTNCSELLGCHLGTTEGQRAFADQNLARRCRELTAKSAELTMGVLEGLERDCTARRDGAG